ncbi:pantetheine-phosphate adenylyltransferase [Thermoproteota archaeon]
MKQAVYPGSFDPITNGHIDIVKRASRLFDELYIGVIANPQKKALFSVDERISLIQDVFKNEPNVFVQGFEGLLIDFVCQKKITNIIRGLRAVSDFDYEFQMALTNRKLQPDINTVFFMTDAKYSYLSSSLVKELAYFNADVSDFVPGIVLDHLKQKMADINNA